MTENRIHSNIRKPRPNGNGHAVSKAYHPVHSAVSHDVAFGYPRDFLRNQFVYLVVSPRARGLAVGINLNPIVKCNFTCLYCEVDRLKPSLVKHFDSNRMAAELKETLEITHAGELRRLPRYANLPDELLQVHHVALSGDGEPTLSNDFEDALGAIVHIRALSQLPFFKIVLITNSTALDRLEVRRGLELLTRKDEVWAKLDGGTQAYLNKVNGSSIRLEQILDNILTLGRRRPVVIQSLFPAIHGAEPGEAEIREYAQRLKELKEAGAEIPLVQIYSATRPMARVGCGHLPLKCLSRIAQTVRRVSGLRTEVF